MSTRPSARRRQPSLWTAFLITLGFGALMAVSFQMDAPFLRWILAGGARPWQKLAEAASEFGDWPWLAGSAVAGIVLARVFAARSWMNLLCLMLASSILAGAVVNPLRAVTGRARPSAKVAAGWYGPREAGKFTVGKHSYSSFPSAHTTVSAAFFSPLVFVLGGAGWLGWLPVLLIGWSRLYLGVHHPSDVVVGAVLGWCCAWLLCRWPRYRWWLWRSSSFLCGKRRAWPSGASRWALPFWP